MITDKKVRSVKFWITISVVILLFIICIFIMLKYSNEGEKKLPYKLSKITIISTAEGVEDTNNEEDLNEWNLKILQKNDVYISIDKTEFCQDGEMLESVKIENIEIIQSPKIGVIKSFMPNSLDGVLFNYIDNYLVEDSLEYRGANKSNYKTLEIGNQGGTALISFVNTEIGNFKSQEKNIEIKHDGTLISKINEIKIFEQDLKFKIKFDLIIQIEKNKYRGEIILDLPCGEIISNGTASVEKTDFSEIIFKKEK